MPLNNPQAAFTTCVKLETRVGDAASGDVSYTGYGFTPRGLSIQAESTVGSSIGTSEPALAEHGLHQTGTMIYRVDEVVHIGGNAAVYQKAVVKTYDADGFTLTWTKNGASPATLINLHVFAFK